MCNNKNCNGRDSQQKRMICSNKGCSFASKEIQGGALICRLCFSAERTRLQPMSEDYKNAPTLIKSTEISFNKDQGSFEISNDFFEFVRINEDKKRREIEKNLQQNAAEFGKTRRNMLQLSRNGRPWSIMEPPQL